MKLPFGLEHQVYDKILPYLEDLENPLDICTIINGFFTTVNRITMDASTPAGFLHPQANPYEIPSRFVTTFIFSVLHVISREKLWFTLLMF